MQPEVSYILYAISSHEQTGNIITFAQFEEGVYWEKRNVKEDGLILDSIDDSYIDNDSDELSIIINAF